MAQLGGRSAFLRPVVPADYGRILSAEFSGAYALRGRLGGQTVPIEEMGAFLGRSTLCQFIVCARSDLEPLGLVYAYNAELRHGRCSLGAHLMAEPQPGDVRFLLGTLLFVNYVFEQYPVRKIYTEISERSQADLRTAISALEVEGRLVEYDFIDGSYQDRLILSMSRTFWESHRTRWLRIAAGPNAAEAAAPPS